MGIQIIGNGGTVAEVGGTTFRSLMMSPKPDEYGSLGHYRFSRIISMVVSQNANSTLLAFRWGDATRFCVIKKIKLSLQQTAIQTATIFPRIQVFVARSYSASDTGGTALTITGNSFKKRTNMGTTLVTDIRVSAAAGGVTPGTRTPDADPIIDMPTQQPATTLTAIRYDAELDIGAGDGNCPVILAQNEGIIVRGPTTAFGVAGTADLVWDMSWAEVNSY
jgi:hypothetical protein